MNDENINSDLFGKSSIKRRKIAEKILKKRLTDYYYKLPEALNVEFSLKNNWETCSSIIDIIGELEIEAGYAILSGIISEPDNHEEMVIKQAAKSICRLIRVNELDNSKILEILKTTDNYFIKEGVLEWLGYYKVVPEFEEQKLFIEMCFDFGDNKEKYFSDPRYGLAAACAGWDLDVCKDFLEKCLMINDIPLNYVAKNSLKSKYVKLR